MRICTVLVILSLSAMLAVAQLPTPPTDFYFEVRLDLNGQSFIHRKVWGSATAMRSWQTSVLDAAAARHTNLEIDNTTSYQQSPPSSTCTAIPLVWPPSFVDDIPFDLATTNVTCPFTSVMSCDEYNGTLVTPFGAVVLKFYFIMDTNTPAAVLASIPVLGPVPMPLNFTFVEGLQDPSVFINECLVPLVPPTEYPCAIHMKLRTVIRAFGDTNITSDDEQWYQDGYWKWKSVFVNPTGFPPSPHDYIQIGRPDLNVTFHDDFNPPHCDILPPSSMGLPLNYSEFKWTKTTPVEFKGQQCDRFHGISPTIEIDLHFIASTPLLLGGSGTFQIMGMKLPLTVDVVSFEVGKRMPMSLFAAPCTDQGTFPPAPEPSQEFIDSCFDVPSSIVQSGPVSNAPWTAAAAPAMLAVVMAAAL